MINERRQNTIELVLAIVLATSGQILLSRQDLRGLGLYALAILVLLMTLRRDEQIFPGGRTDTRPNQGRFGRLWRWLLLPLALANASLAFLAASGNTYRWYGVVAWLLAVGLFLLIFWERDPVTPAWRKLGLSREGWRLSWTALAVAGLILLGFWFRFWRLAELPPEMNSDHVEKLMDVHDLVTGQRPIFFTRNTGREPWQFYWTLAFMRLFDLELKYFALKVGTAAVSLLTLPGVYLLGREMFGRRVGLWATLFSAVSSWPVLISRIGLRYPFNPAITPWSLFFLLRGLRRGERNDFLLLGLSLGVGLQGYTAFRAMPLAVGVCWLVCLFVGWLRPEIVTLRPSTLVRNALLTVLIALIVFIPLGRYSLEYPEHFWYRSFSRVSNPDYPYQGSPPVILAKNLWNLALMFHWDGDEVWVAHWRRDAPVLDPLLGALLVLGLVMILRRILRQRDLLSLCLVIAGGLLLLPSALSLAFPSENPSVVRTGGAIPVVMILAALPVGLGLNAAQDRSSGWRRAGVRALSLVLAISVVAVNRQRIFTDYAQQYNQFSINATEIADAIRGFARSGGDLSNAYIKGWPHWVDTRGVGIELGQIGWNNALLDINAADAHLDLPRPRFYVLHPHDATSLTHLRELFPDGWSAVYASRYPGKSFIVYYVPLPEISPIP
jgi:hypothetical protein